MAHEMTEERYAECVDHLYHLALKRRMLAFLELLAGDFRDEGYEVSEVADWSDDDYRHAFFVSGNDLAEPVNASLALAESLSYGDVEGVSFALHIGSNGGEIIGGLTPYNYSPECWVDVRDVRAVSDRLAIIEECDRSAAVDLVNQWRDDHAA